jgi:formate-dependent nitrite reductase membrane component NrfD
MSEARRMGSPVIPVIALILGVVGGLVANYTLDHLADTSDAWHQIQHGTFFVSGILVGYALLALYLHFRKSA